MRDNSFYLNLFHFYTHPFYYKLIQPKFISILFQQHVIKKSMSHSRISSTLTLVFIISWLMSQGIMAQSISGVPVSNQIQQYFADIRMVESIYEWPYDAGYLQNKRSMMAQRWEKCNKIPLAKISIEDQVNLTLLKREIQLDLEEVQQQQDNADANGNIFQFHSMIAPFLDARRVGIPEDSAQLHLLFNSLESAISQKIPELKVAELEERQYASGGDYLRSLQKSFEEAFRFYKGFDPALTTGVKKEFALADSALLGCQREFGKIVKARRSDTDTLRIFGEPIGEAALVRGLKSEFIAYSPAELLLIADKELAWCHLEMKKASAAMGLGDDWRDALDKIKDDYVPRGMQPQYVRSQAFAAIDFIERKKLIAVPEEAKTGWGMQMISPEGQKYAPFFLGGQSIHIAYAHEEMIAAEQLMSMRGNNKHFVHAVIFHELIPGHNLQYYYANRYNTYRRQLHTSFWTEGWSLYWEILLYKNNYATTPEDKLGMLFWRMHRCARIIFSIKFHTGEWTPQQCVNFLVDEIGHERANAEAEVRRSIDGGYGPLYQIGYMMGGLQFLALHREFVESGKMTDIQFHEKILRGGAMPVALVRPLLSGRADDLKNAANWRFYKF